MLSISFLPWILLMLFCVIAVPVAAKLAPTRTAVSYGGGNEYSDGDAMEDYDMVEDPAAAAAASSALDDFGADPGLGDAQPLGDDAFAEFN